MVGKAARLLYLNRTCWNGLYRVNEKGEFNVPVGRFNTTPDIVRAAHIRAASSALQNCEIECRDFGYSCSNLRRGDTVFADPPYTVTHANNGFIRYNEAIFSWSDQVRLARLAHRLAARGVRVIVSNADHKSIRELYCEFHCKKLSRNSMLAASASKRRRVTEMLFTSFPIETKP